MGEREGNRRYDYETKLAAVRDHVEHGLTKAEVMEKYRIAVCFSKLASAL